MGKERMDGCAWMDMGDGWGKKRVEVQKEEERSDCGSESAAHLI
jgi:hypothetical protein